MRKIVILFLSVFGLLMSSFFVYSDDVRDLFIDVDDNYEYLRELQHLSDKGIVIPDEDDQLNDDRVMKRGEFVGHAFKLGCENCLPFEITPRIVLDHARKSSFFDLKKEDEYFFCSEESNTQQYMLNYGPGTVCEDGVSQNNSMPFCSDNTVTRQEAVRAILLMSGVYDEDDYAQDLTLLNNNQIDRRISTDMQAIDNAGNINPYFLYLRKALSFTIEERDLSGNLIRYDFLDLQADGSIGIDTPLTRNEFIKMAYIASKASGCEDKHGDFAALIDVYPATCEIGEECGKDPLTPDARSYDLKANFSGTCRDGIEEDTNIVWRMYHPVSNTLNIAYGTYIDNADLSQTGERLVYLGVLDNCNRSSYAKTTLFIGEDGGGINLSVEANPNNTELGNTIDFRAIILGDSAQETVWDFGDQEFGNGENVSHTYEVSGTYLVHVHNGEQSAYVHVNLYESQIDIAVFIDIYEAQCDPNDESIECRKANLEEPATSYDFYANYAGACSEGVEESSITRVFKNLGTGTTERRTGTYIDNFDFLEEGMRSINLQVTDKCGQYGSANSYLEIGDGGNNSGSSLGIEADGINVQPGGTINFTGLSSDPDADDYVWDFGDGSTGQGQTTSHTFNSVGTYTVELQSGGNTAYITVNVYEDSTGADRDNDGIPDDQDLCPDIPGVAANGGCPILPGDADGDGILDSEDDCPGQAGPSSNGGCPVTPGDADGDGVGDDEDGCPNTAGPASNGGCPEGEEPGEIENLCGGGNGGCPSGYICSIFPGGPGEGVCLIDDVCSLALHGGSAGNVTCNECPCNYSVNFDAQLKVCDIVFPAITSPDGSRIYSKGEIYQILQ